MRITRPKLQDVESKARIQHLSRPWLLTMMLWAVGLVVLSLVSFSKLNAQSLRSTAAQAGIFVAGVDSVYVNRRVATPGQVIRSGDVIQTDASGRARFIFLNNTTVHLAGNSELKVDRAIAASSGRPATLIVDMNRGVGRVIAGDRRQREVALIRGGGSIAAIQSGALDMVSSNGRLVTAMRSGSASCRSSSGQIVTMTESQRACILAGGAVRPSVLSAAMARAIDDRMSVPPSALARAIQQPAPRLPATASLPTPTNTRSVSSTQTQLAKRSETTSAPAQASQPVETAEPELVAPTTIVSTAARDQAQLEDFQVEPVEVQDEGQSVAADEVIIDTPAEPVQAPSTDVLAPPVTEPEAPSANEPPNQPLPAPTEIIDDLEPLLERNDDLVTNTLENTTSE